MGVLEVKEVTVDLPLPFPPEQLNRALYDVCEVFAGRLMSLSDSWNSYDLSTCR
jgi:hypothetical protein